MDFTTSADSVLTTGTTVPESTPVSYSATYEGLGGVTFFTVLLLGVVVVKRLPKSWLQSHGPQRLFDRLRA